MNCEQPNNIKQPWWLTTSHLTTYVERERKEDRPIDYSQQHLLENHSISSCFLHPEASRRDFSGVVPRSFPAQQDFVVASLRAAHVRHRIGDVHKVLWTPKDSPLLKPVGKRAPGKSRLVLGLNFASQIFRQGFHTFIYPLFGIARRWRPPLLFGMEAWLVHRGHHTLSPEPWRRKFSSPYSSRLSYRGVPRSQSLFPVKKWFVAHHQQHNFWQLQ